MKVLVTGSSGLIGSEMVHFFDSRAKSVIGIDNNMRAQFFGPDGDTRWNLERLRRSTRHFQHQELDIRDRAGVETLFVSMGPFELIIHCAAQPSHAVTATNCSRSAFRLARRSAAAGMKHEAPDRKPAIRRL